MLRPYRSRDPQRTSQGGNGHFVKVTIIFFFLILSLTNFHLRNKRALLHLLKDANDPKKNARKPFVLCSSLDFLCNINPRCVVVFPHEDVEIPLCDRKTPGTPNKANSQIVKPKKHKQNTIIASSNSHQVDRLTPFVCLLHQPKRLLLPSPPPVLHLHDPNRKRNNQNIRRRNPQIDPMSLPVRRRITRQITPRSNNRSNVTKRRNQCRRRRALSPSTDIVGSPGEEGWTEGKGTECGEEDSEVAD
ncbi:hypothetical protein G7K_4121-t1 [Saitoella complicata NRRL Y-17804]|uniref:Uncharacterized protein n=1 Tax=Saitoella complicata (strain BCRC 22490 / CBS 7301 / JCM 7358 / NBRC 10748 / NRRL Y-17804) TaxID=698492 RepID=A0A0E9NJX7_SAICN|nr:hypothetical protein G7K_4121-t1 [Saitoella complicata NRRL Y-17804]